MQRGPRLKQSEDVLQEALDFLSLPKGLFSAPLDHTRVHGFRGNPSSTELKAKRFRANLNSLGNQIVSSGRQSYLLPQIADTIQILDLILTNNGSHTSVRQLHASYVNETVRLTKKTSLRVKLAMGFKARIAKVTLARRDSHLTLREIPVQERRLAKTYDILQLSGEIRGRIADVAMAREGHKGWVITNLPTDQKIDPGHLQGRRWDAYELEARSHKIGEEGGYHRGPVSVTLISNTNGARNFTPDTLGLNYSNYSDAIRANMGSLKHFMLERELNVLSSQSC